jgi:hypothetical protein
MQMGEVPCFVARDLHSGDVGGADNAMKAT